MSFAWQVTEEDVLIVASRHDRGLSPTAPGFKRMVAVAQDDGNRVEGAALAYLDMDDQTESALDEIETILIEHGLLTAPKLFTAP